MKILLSEGETHIISENCPFGVLLNYAQSSPFAVQLPIARAQKKKHIIEAKEGSCPMRKTTLSIQVRAGFSNYLRLLNTNQGNSLPLKGKKDNLTFLNSGNEFWGWCGINM